MVNARHPTIQELQEIAATMGRVRWRRASDVAQVAAHFLRCHPRVRAVRYPGLKSDPLFQDASCALIGGFGPIVDYLVDDEWRRLSCEEVDPKEVVLALERSLRE